MVLGTLAEHSIPFSKAPVIVELAQILSLDKPALQGMKLSRTAASYKMIHGLGIYIFFLTYYFSVLISILVNCTHKKCSLNYHVAIYTAMLPEFPVV